MNKITEALKVCEAAAREQGLQGSFTPTELDLDSICQELGRKPTREEWLEAGLRWIGDDHCGE